VQLDKLFDWRYWEAFTDWQVWRFLLTGLQTTVAMAIAAILASFVLGTLLAFARISRFPPAHYLAVAYIEVIRALPVLFLIFFTYFGGARLGFVNPVIAATIALTAYTAAVNAEIIRAGILSIDRGEIEAARSLGLSHLQTMRFVVLPQAFRRIVPPQMSQFVTLIKDTSLAYVVGTHEFLRRMRIISGEPDGPGTLQGLFVAACTYFVINYALSLLSRGLEARTPQEAAQHAGAEAGRPTVEPAGQGARAGV
jgi:putative glutamine transport system permease protein